MKTTLVIAPWFSAVSWFIHTPTGAPWTLVVCVTCGLIAATSTLIAWCAVKMNSEH